ncbi:MAG: methyltransferase [Bifidobacteriaceae bacterium]|nr:methyltransferase [Bifidobacteriaceae bacterium]
MAKSLKIARKVQNADSRSQSNNDETQQYFTSEPTSQDIRRKLHVTLRDYDLDVETSTGVFSTHRVDLGTSVLLRHAPELAVPNGANLLDVGCGWGPLSLAMALEAPEAKVWSIDTNTRAIELTTHNASLNNITNIHACAIDEVPANIQFDCIWSNPPIRVGKQILHEILLMWIPRLKPQGSAYLVVQKNLGSDSLIPWLQTQLGESYTVSKYASSKGYRVIEVIREA